MSTDDHAGNKSHYEKKLWDIRERLLVVFMAYDDDGTDADLLGARYFIDRAIARLRGDDVRGVEAERVSEWAPAVVRLSTESRTRKAVEELLHLILVEMRVATNRDLAADGPVGNEEEGVWAKVEAKAEELQRQFGGGG